MGRHHVLLGLLVAFEASLRSCVGTPESSVMVLCSDLPGWAWGGGCLHPDFTCVPHCSANQQAGILLCEQTHHHITTPAAPAA